MQKYVAMNLDQQVRALGSVPFSHGSLLPLLHGYKRPNDKIARWLADGQLVQLRRGLYVLGNHWRTMPVSLPLLANALMGPSYVSLEFALSWHGLIPESVQEVSSVTMRRGRLFETPLGRFSYLHVPSAWFAIGVRMEAGQDGLTFLMASPTKAICDKLVLTRRLQAVSGKSMRAFLFEDLRLEPEAVRALDQDVIRQCLATGHKLRHLQALQKCVEAMQ
ncbi:MAG: hypothetical protein COW02_10860 [Comamonadaceae bacterium CG12_big_fil_rev_8_21_14_0_65_59_15]|nr:MAG: hypothetical protein COW02_10860 [Comamonadaceae bacterium CG12_big_fil_rev_8_21_14_0_65_59_15]